MFWPTNFACEWWLCFRCCACLSSRSPAEIVVCIGIEIQEHNTSLHSAPYQVHTSVTLSSEVLWTHRNVQEHKPDRLLCNNLELYFYDSCMQWHMWEILNLPVLLMRPEIWNPGLNKRWNTWSILSVLCSFSEAIFTFGVWCQIVKCTNSLLTIHKSGSRQINASDIPYIYLHVISLEYRSSMTSAILTRAAGKQPNVKISEYVCTPTHIGASCSLTQQRPVLRSLDRADQRQRIVACIAVIFTILVVNFFTRVSPLTLPYRMGAIPRSKSISHGHPRPRPWINVSSNYTGSQLLRCSSLYAVTGCHTSACAACAEWNQTSFTISPVTGSGVGAEHAVKSRAPLGVTFLPIIVPPFQGSSALMNLLDSSPATSTMCHLHTWQCEPTKFLIEHGIFDHEQRFDANKTNWTEVYRLYHKEQVWDDPNAPILMDKAPPNILKTKEMVRFFQENNYNYKMIVMWRSPCRADWSSIHKGEWKQRFWFSLVSIRDANSLGTVRVGHGCAWNWRGYGALRWGSRRFFSTNMLMPLFRTVSVSRRKNRHQYASEVCFLVHCTVYLAFLRRYI